MAWWPGSTLSEYYCCVLTGETPSSHPCSAEINHLDLGWEWRRCEEDHCPQSTLVTVVWGEGRDGSRPGGTQLLEFTQGPEILKPPLMMELDIHYFAMQCNEVMSLGIIIGC